MKKLYSSLTVFCSMALMSVTAQNLTFTNPSGSGKCDGVANFSPGPITAWMWYKDSVMIQNGGQMVDSLCAGKYSVKYKDATSTLVVKPFELLVNTSGGSRVKITKGASAAGKCDAEASFDPGPIANWKWVRNDTTVLQTGGKTIVGLCEGDHAVEYLDSTGTKKLYDRFRIQAGTTNTTTTNTGSGSGRAKVVLNVSASGKCDGKAHFDQGPVTSWKWFKDSTLVQTGGLDLMNLCEGDYRVEYMDSAGTNKLVDRFHIGVANSTTSGGGGNDGGKGNCANFEAHPVTTALSGPGKCDATAEVVFVLAGTPPYTYFWSGSNATTKSRTGLCAGGYRVKVSDSKGCYYTDSTNISYNSANPCENFGAHIIPKKETKPGACDGSAEAIADAGAAPYTYHWSNTNVNTNVNGNLCSGKYTLKVVDNRGCSAVDSVTIDAATSTVTNPCEFFNVRTLVVNDTVHPASVACGGYVEAVCKGGRGALTYTWTGSTNKTPFIKNACEGKYTVTVKDSMGCQASFTAYVGVDKPVTMMPAPKPGVMPMRLFVQTKDVSNSSLCNGKAYAKVEGGKAPFKFQFGAKTGTGDYFIMDSLCAGFYTVNAMDADSMKTAFTFVIGSPATTYVPPVIPFVNPVIKDTLVAPAVPTCDIDYDKIDSIRITFKEQFGADSLKVKWTVFQNGTNGNHIVVRYYNISSATGICKLVLDLFCTNRASGSAKAEDYVDLSAVGIDDVSTTPTSVYPNPFNDQVNVVLDKIAAINVFDISGRNVYSVSHNGGTTTVNTVELNTGMYFITITFDGTTVTRKLIKE